MTALCGFTISFALSFALTGILVWRSRRPSAELLQSLHRGVRSISRFGGVSIFFSFFLAVIIILRVFHQWDSCRDDFSTIFLASLLLFIGGLFDDWRGLHYFLKVLLQMGAALILVKYGFVIEIVTNPFNGAFAFGPLAIPITVIWILLLINAINLIDGLDGLAAGIVAIASASLLILSFASRPFLTIVSASLFGSLLGFLRFNFYPARIFLGDSGSLVLGLILAAVSIGESIKGATAATLSLPLIALMIPLGNIASVFLQRVFKKKNPFIPSGWHLHYKLLRVGMSHRGVVLFLWGLSFFFGALGVFSVYASKHDMLFVLGAMFLGFFFIMKWIEEMRLDRKRNLELK